MYMLTFYSVYFKANDNSHRSKVHLICCLKGQHQNLFCCNLAFRTGKTVVALKVFSFLFFGFIRSQNQTYVWYLNANGCWYYEKKWYIVMHNSSGTEWNLNLKEIVWVFLADFELQVLQLNQNACIFFLLHVERLVQIRNTVLSLLFFSAW